MRLKAALTQQHPPVTNGDTVKGHSSGLVRTQSEESRPQSLQQPATSTTETPASPAHTTPQTQSTTGRRRRAANEDPDEKGGNFWSEIEQQLQDADRKGKSGFSL